MDEFPHSFLLIGSGVVVSRASLEESFPLIRANGIIRSPQQILFGYPSQDFVAFSTKLNNLDFSRSMSSTYLKKVKHSSTVRHVPFFGTQHHASPHLTTSTSHLVAPSFSSSHCSGMSSSSWRSGACALSVKLKNWH